MNSSFCSVPPYCATSIPNGIIITAFNSKNSFNCKLLNWMFIPLTIIGVVPLIRTIPTMLGMSISIVATRTTTIRTIANMFGVLETESNV